MQEVKCPKCGEKRKVSPPVGFTCRGCGARLSVSFGGLVKIMSKNK